MSDFAARRKPNLDIPWWARWTFPSSRFSPGLLVVVLMGAPSCREDIISPFDEVHAFVGDIGTMVTVEWVISGSSPQLSWVEVTGFDGSERTVDAERDADGTYRARVFQLEPNTPYHYQAAMFRDGYIARSAQKTISTNAVPQVIPELNVEETGSGVGTDGLLLTVLISNISCPVILDANSDLIWWYIQDDEDLAATRALLSSDGEHVLFNSFNVDAVFPSEEGDTGTEVGESYIYKVSLDGSEISVLETPMGHHDFTQLPDGTLAYLTAEFQEHEGQLVRGDGVVELAPDGTVTQIWSAWDDPELYSSWFPSQDFVLPMANALEYVESEDAYYVSLGQIIGIGTFVKIDRGTGEPVWLLGGETSDIEILSQEREFSHQHQFDVLDNGILMFDNGLEIDMDSRAVEYSLDQHSMQAEQVWSYHAEPALYTYAGGDASRLPEGGTVISWGTAGQLDELDPDGQLVRRLNTQLGAATGYLQWLDGLAAEP